MPERVDADIGVEQKGHGRNVTAETSQVFQWKIPVLRGWQRFRRPEVVSQRPEALPVPGGPAPLVQRPQYYGLALSANGHLVAMEPVGLGQPDGLTASGPEDLGTSRGY